MTKTEWLECREPDLMLEFLVGKISRQQLVEFVRQCWEHIRPLIAATRHEITVVEQFEEIAERQSDMDAANYANEAALKAAGWADSMADEQVHQADLLRRIVGDPFRG